jgi:hypothetical protein
MTPNSPRRQTEVQAMRFVARGFVMSCGMILPLFAATYYTTVSMQTQPKDWAWRFAVETVQFLETKIELDFNLQLRQRIFQSFLRQISATASRTKIYLIDRNWIFPTFNKRLESRNL